MKRRSIIMVCCVAGAVLAGVAAEVGLTRRARAFGHWVRPAERERAEEAAAERRGIDWGRDVRTYNCAGLAFGTYREMSMEEVEGVLAAGFRRLDQPDAPCPPGWVKVWVWEYDVHHETEDGVKDEPHRDGHVVAGRTSLVDGSGPGVVFCKYGAGPVLGPGPAESWAPLAREEEGRNYRGARVYVVRENMVERWYAGPVSAMPR